MHFTLLASTILLASLASSQNDRSAASSRNENDGFTFATSVMPVTLTSASISIPSGPYQTYSSQLSATGTAVGRNGTMPSNATMTSSSSTNTLYLVGASDAATSTRSSARPSNTQPCNGYPEYCSKRYMNITEVCAHNSAFAKRNNAASNQAINIVGQLNDGVRMIQGETHYVNDTIYSCHTSCDILNSGPLADELTTVRHWVENHPYDVVTILLVNSDYTNVQNYISPLMDSGLGPFLYEPLKIPMHRYDWPTYQDIILSGKRVVIFLDYMANQTQVPYILDEFSQMWETPFSPTDENFPCDQQRPPGLNSEQQDLVPYIANHNLNVQISLGSSSILIPNFEELDQVNSVNGTQGRNSTGALGAMARQCKQRWGRPPAWLLVDFYNYGNFNGSVFEVAAQMNNVTYNRKSCCGQDTKVGAAPQHKDWSPKAMTLLILAAFVGSRLLI